MMVLFVSECRKKALPRTQRILDSFANRIGARTWRTAITQQGLESVHRHLRQSASKNTAVACHRIQGTGSSQLLFIVGDRSGFDGEGSVPVARTAGNRFSSDESAWSHMPAIKALVAVAALLHDWGKASECFQTKLQARAPSADPLRHEWISCVLLRALVDRSEDPTTDRSWLEMLADGRVDVAPSEADSGAGKHLLTNLPPVAQMVFWLVLSHHRLPAPHKTDQRRLSHLKQHRADTAAQILELVNAYWGYENLWLDGNDTRIGSCFHFPMGHPFQCSSYTKRVSKWASRLAALVPELSAFDELQRREILTHARLALMLGDHNYSSRAADPNWKSDLQLFANTIRDGPNAGEFSQRLDEHLAGVERDAVRVAHWLPHIACALPHAQDLHRLSRRSPPAFRWQDKAAAVVRRWRVGINDQPVPSSPAFFGINMASTGTGKTVANAKIMRALSSDGSSLRYTLAVGLRTLTLQTGDAYREQIGMDDSQLAVMIGSRAVADLHHARRQIGEPSGSDGHPFEESGSESAQPLSAAFLEADVNMPDDVLKTVLHNVRDRQMLYAPVLCCTVDHLMGATETRRGGRYILPQLRLLSSDLVIDEVDDFDGEDLICIGRLVHLAGLLGRKVLLSSATVPPDLAQGLFRAYAAGRRAYARAHSLDDKIACGWVDEFRANTDVLLRQDGDYNFRAAHDAFVAQRIDSLRELPVRRRAFIVDTPEPTTTELEPDKETVESQYFGCIIAAAKQLHADHHTLAGERRVSFGVVRMANVDPAIRLAEHMMATDWSSHSVRIMSYHSRQVLLLRSRQEAHLDAVLQRKEARGEPPAFLSDAIIAEHLSASTGDVMFVVVATPVEEVGRDHDFDWAVIEPSSFRSIVQMAGRVRRHRDPGPEAPNIALLRFNLRALTGVTAPGGARIAFRWPGYESEVTPLASHDLRKLLPETLYSSRIDAGPRIIRPAELSPAEALLDLEHHVLEQSLNESANHGPETLNGYTDGAWWSTGVPQHFVRFRRSSPSLSLFLSCRPDETVFCEKDKWGQLIPRQELYRIRFDDVVSTGLEWMRRDMREAAQQEAERRGLSVREASKRFGEITFLEKYTESDLFYTDQFGLRRK